MKKTAMGFYLVLIALALSILLGVASACQVDEFYLTNGGHMAASTPDNLIKAEKADQQHITGMIKSGEVLRLQENIRVQAKERSVEYQMIKVKLPDSDTQVWVREDALKRCEQ